MGKYVAAIDQGTTSTRCMVFDQQGAAVGSAQQEHRQLFPRPGWVEHDPMEIWRCTQAVVRVAISHAKVFPGDIAAVGITNQRETTLVWNRRTGQPYHNAIVWQDVRTKDICERLSLEGGQNRFQSKVGLPLATYFSGPKLRWLLDNVDGLYEAALDGEAVFGNIDSWLIWWLTGGPDGGAHVTDVTNASRTMLMDLQSLDWDRDMLDSLDIPRQMLPRIVASSDPDSWGSTQPDGPFGSTIPVCGDLGDQQAALVGQACFEPGEAKNTYGTGCFMLLNTGHQPTFSEHGLLTTVAYRLGNEPAVYALEGSIAIAGALVQWLRDNLGLIQNSGQVEALARESADNGGVYFVPAFSGLFAPYWRSDARGVLVGLTRYANKAHIARAALEATAFQTYEVLEAMKQDSGVTLTELRADGGMVQNELLMQFQSDILGVPVVRPSLTETTSLGAAYAAGLAVGFWKNLDDLRANWLAGRRWEPKMGPDERLQLIQGWHKAIERSLDWVE
jgi:glycerol kinase